MLQRGGREVVARQMLLGRIFSSLALLSCLVYENCGTIIVVLWSEKSLI